MNIKIKCDKCNTVDIKENTSNQVIKDKFDIKYNDKFNEIVVTCQNCGEQIYISLD